MADSTDHIIQKAAEYVAPAPALIANLLGQIGDEILTLGDELIAVCERETGLDSARLTGERTRTVNQLKMFADVVREGSWVDARIDRAKPGRVPLPKPGLRRMLFPIGPVGVFAASNFPLAFSVAGGDTASAIAAGCAVVVKPHPGHPETSRLVRTAIGHAVARTGFSPAVFGMLTDENLETGLALVKHPVIRAVGFTGSLTTGRALLEAASSRPDPIPVFTEMGSMNPVFLLPAAVATQTEAIARGLAASATLGNGQFCTKPGLIFGIRNPSLDSFRETLAETIARTPVARMLTPQIEKRFRASLEPVRRWLQASGGAHLLVADGQTYRSTPELRHELFGPVTLLVECSGLTEMIALAAELDGQLTATIHGAPDDIGVARELLNLLPGKAGRVIWNGYPTGVEVTPAMQHGGPFPATSDPRFTSVGSAAILRFARPVCFQDLPDDLLPGPLKNQNTHGIWRWVDNELTRDSIEN